MISDGVGVKTKYVHLFPEKKFTCSSSLWRIIKEIEEGKDIPPQFILDLIALIFEARMVARSIVHEASYAKLNDNQSYMTFFYEHYPWLLNTNE